MSVFAFIVVFALVAAVISFVMMPMSSPKSSEAQIAFVHALKVCVAGVLLVSAGVVPVLVAGGL